MKLWTVVVLFTTIIIFLHLYLFTFGTSNPVNSQRCHVSRRQDVSYFDVTLLFPQRKFHSNHWFHLGEHYVSQFESSQVNSNFTQIVIRAEDQRFMMTATPMTLFMIMISIGISDYSHVSEIQLMSANMTSQTRTMTFHPNNVPESQFFINEHHLRSKENCQVDIPTYFAGISMGHMPVHSSQWFTRPGSVEKLRHVICDLCHAGMCGMSYQEYEDRYRRLSSDHWRVHRDWTALQSSPAAEETNMRSETETADTDTDTGHSHKLAVVYERDSNRHFAQLALLLSGLSSGLSSSWRIDVLHHSEALHPCTLHAALRQADLFVTTHGFQSTALLFMRPGALIFEVFPYKYFKDSYVHLATAMGVQHRWLQNARPTSPSRYGLLLLSQQTCMSHIRCRSHARGDSVSTTAQDVQAIVAAALELHPQFPPQSNISFT